MFPSESLEEQRFGWLALWSVNHALASRKEIFRACSLVIHPSIHPPIPESSHQTRGVAVTPNSLPMLPSSLWVGYFISQEMNPLFCRNTSHGLTWKASCKTCHCKLKLESLFAPWL